MAVRVATPADIFAMQRVRRSVRENVLTDYSVLTDAMYRERIEEHGRGWVDEQGERIVGFAVADLRDASIWALFVEPEWERRGIGRALHDAMLEWLRSRGLTRVRLTTEPCSRAARFYEAAGWGRTEIDARGEAVYERTC